MRPTSCQLRIGIVLAGLLALLGVSTLDDTGPWFVLNETRSVPTGLYWLDRGEQVDVGDLIWFEVPPSVAELVHERGYIPPGGKLLKRIVAAEGERWCVHSDLSFVVAKARHGVAFLSDVHGKPLKPIDGCSIVPPGHVLVAGDHPRSFDSRYFGAIPIHSVIGEARPVWISSH